MWVLVLQALCFLPAAGDAKLNFIFLLTNYITRWQNVKEGARNAQQLPAK